MDESIIMQTKNQLPILTSQKLNMLKLSL